MSEARGQEKRWYQKPEFIWTIAVFVFLQVGGKWKDSLDERAKEAVRNDGIEKMVKAFADFQNEVRQRFQSQEQRITEYQSEQRKMWQDEHDNNGRTANRAESVAKELDEFKGDVKRRFETDEALIGNARERIGKLEVKP